MIMGFHRYNVPISLSAVNTHSFSAFANHYATLACAFLFRCREKVRDPPNSPRSVICWDLFYLIFGTLEKKLK